MSIGQADQGGAITCAALAVEGEMTIYRAAELKPVLLDAVRADGAAALDLAAVTEFDSAGVQLVLMARREAAALGKALTIVAASPAVRDVFAMLGLAIDDVAGAMEGTAA